jgi:hypothetical protein
MKLQFEKYADKNKAIRAFLLGKEAIKMQPEKRSTR